MNATIKLNNPNEVQEFVNAASQCSFEIDIFYNRFLVDAKSLLGVLSMDLTNALSVDCHGYDYNFETVLRKYSVA